MKKQKLGERLAPRRTLTKHQAVRHLLHAAVRMFAAGEDPFATHMLIQSAEKLLIDLAKHSPSGKLTYDWTTIMKPEFKDALLDVHRETYNFFKHADKDHDQSLHVGDIAMSNILQLGACIHNFHGLSGEFTDHMRLGSLIARLVFPNGFVSSEHRDLHDASTAALKNFTLREFFSASQTKEILMHFPNFAAERKEDLQDTSYLLDRPFQEIK